jgi:hypothetical protein
MLTNFQMTHEQFEELPFVQLDDVKLGTLFIFRFFNDFGLCIIEEIEDEELTFRIIGITKRCILKLDESHKIVIENFLRHEARGAEQEKPSAAIRLYAKA